MMTPADPTGPLPQPETTENMKARVAQVVRKRTGDAASGEHFTTIDIGTGAKAEYAQAGQPSDSLRDQSKRLSRLLTRRTELHDHDPSAPDPPEVSRNETSGWNYWLHEVWMAKEHGGDFAIRRRAAARAAVGSLATFSALVLPRQQIFGAVWIGNIFMHSNLKGSFGESLDSFWQFSRSIVLTTAVSWPIARFLAALSTTQACIIFPFLVFIASFMIMSSPHLTSRNLMILVMYVAVAAPVRDNSIPWWMPLGFVGTYHVGLAAALVVNFFDRSLDNTHSSLVRLEKDLTMLLLQSKAYSDNTAVVPELSRAATANIEMLYTRIATTVKSLKRTLRSSEVELSLRCRPRAAADLAVWVRQTERLLAPLKSLRTALMQRVIGEEYSTYSSHLREAKAILNEEVGPARDRMVDAMITSIAVCHAWADPSARRTVLPDVHGELKTSLSECSRAFHRAMGKAAERLEANPQTNVPIFAHLTRRMCAFNALFELGENLLTYLEEHSWESEVDLEEQHLGNGRGISSHVCNWCHSFVNFVELSWLWRNPDSFRLAIKTAVGMFLASMFVSVPYLWDISDPFGVWPGLTVASVNLATTGSSFHKAADRLFGTLLAAAFALLVTDLFPGNMNTVKIPAISVFTYIVIYLRSADHAYKFTYAATSIGSMLYGSVKNDFNIASYIPKRIELIFVGVMIFSIVELLLFPRSSRKMVESLGFQYFLSVRDYLRQAAHCTRRMENYVLNSTDTTRYEEAFFDDAGDPFHLERLAQCHSKLKKESSKLKKELESGLDEPHLGLSMKLHPESFRGLAKEQGDCEIQALLLLNALKKLAGYCQEKGHPIRELNWPKVHAQFLEHASTTTDRACEWLATAYPDGRLRAQQGNWIKAVTAAASFRGLEEVRLRVIACWSQNYQEFIQQNGSDTSDPVAMMSLGCTTSFLLELCRHLQKAGKHVENIAHNFPAVRE